MKYALHSLVLILGLATSLFTWTYIQRSKFDYNSEGRFFNPMDDIVYTEQAKEVYGIFALLALLLTVILLTKLIKRKHP
jgi:hypothetical protein